MGVTIVKVDYDTATDLKRRYGVTMQHTSVQVDGASEPVRTWAGKTVATILADLKG
jgi:thioredoxin 1